MKKTISIAIAVMVLLLGSFWLLKKNAPQAPIHVRINLTPDVASSLIWVADQAGYFKEAGLDVEFKTFTAGKLALEDLIADPQVDAAFAYLSPIVHQLVRGHELRLVTATHTSNRNTRLVAQGEKPANEAAGLRGKKIGVQQGTSAEFALYELLSRQGLKFDDVRLVHAPVTELSRMLTDHEIDAAIAWNPYLANILDDLQAHHQTYWEPELGYHQEFSFLITHADRVDRNSASLEKTIAAVGRAYDLYQKDRAKFTALAAQFPGIGRSPERVGAELQHVDLLLGLNNEMRQTLRAELRYVCTHQEKCDARTLDREDRAFSTSTLENVYPQWVKLKR